MPQLRTNCNFFFYGMNLDISFDSGEHILHIEGLCNKIISPGIHAHRSCIGMSRYHDNRYGFDRSILFDPGTDIYSIHPGQKHIHKGKIELTRMQQPFCFFSSFRCFYGVPIVFQHHLEHGPDIRVIINY